MKKKRFFEKKRAKNFWSASRGAEPSSAQRRAKRTKSFLVLFFKKERLGLRLGEMT